MMASESVALKFLGYRSIVDILPGQAVIIQRGSEPVFCQIQKPKAYTPDIFVSSCTGCLVLYLAQTCFTCHGASLISMWLQGICILRPTRLHTGLNQRSSLSREHG